jgi:anti-sigma regulatory factor (Ser/Thr protein kinase)
VIERRLPSEPAAVASARHHVGRWLDASGIDADRSADVLAVTSELVTSGVLHGGRAPIDVRAWVAADDVYVEVVSGQDAEDRSATALPDDPDAELRSLGIVAMLSDGRAVRVGDDWSAVCCRFGRGWR